MDANTPKKPDAAATPDATTPDVTKTDDAATTPAKTVGTPASDAGKTAATPSTPTAPSGPAAVPSAGGEPVKQAVTASAAHPVPPPTRDAYAMPDDYASESWFDKTKAWVEANPALAVLAAAGAGLVIGRIVTGLAPEPEPPSLTDRIEKRAREIQKGARTGGKKAARQARSFASDAGDTASDQLHRAAEALREAASTVSASAEHGVERTRDLAETVADAVKVALTGVAAKKVDEWVSKVRS